MLLSEFVLLDFEFFQVKILIMLIFYAVFFNKVKPCSFFFYLLKYS